MIEGRGRKISTIMYIRPIYIVALASRVTRGQGKVVTCLQTNGLGYSREFQKEGFEDNTVFTIGSCYSGSVSYRSVVVRNHELRTILD